MKLICKTKGTQKNSKLERKEKQRSLENLEETHTNFSFFPPMFLRLPCNYVNPLFYNDLNG